jgi:hypothetical protein
MPGLASRERAQLSYRVVRFNRILMRAADGVETARIYAVIWAGPRPRAGASRALVMCSCPASRYTATWPINTGDSRAGRSATPVFCSGCENFKKLVRARVVAL